MTPQPPLHLLMVPLPHMLAEKHQKDVVESKAKKAQHKPWLKRQHGLLLLSLWCLQMTRTLPTWPVTDCVEGEKSGHPPLTFTVFASCQVYMLQTWQVDTNGPFFHTFKHTCLHTFTIFLTITSLVSPTCSPLGSVGSTEVIQQ